MEKKLNCKWGENTEKLYTIGEVSKLLNVPKSTIRYWDEQGLIHSSRHEENDYRLFDIDAIFQIYDIDFYRKLDVPIKQMQNLYGKTLEEHYETIAQTEQRIYLEKVELQKKHEEMWKEKRKWKRRLANKNMDLQKKRRHLGPTMAVNSKKF